MISAIVSALHVFALAIGLPGLFLRGRALKGPLDAAGFRQLFASDNAWGIEPESAMPLSGPMCRRGAGQRDD